MEARHDRGGRRKSTFLNAHHRLKMFSGRTDPAGRAEQFERIYVVFVSASSEKVNYECYLAGDPDTQVALDQALNELIEIVVERSPDFYDLIDSALTRVT